VPKSGTVEHGRGHTIKIKTIMAKYQEKREQLGIATFRDVLVILVFTQLLLIVVLSIFIFLLFNK